MAGGDLSQRMRTMRRTGAVVARTYTTNITGAGVATTYITYNASSTSARTYIKYTTYITQDGKMLCKHGRARLTLQWDGKQTRKHGRVPRAACGCLACPIPKRAGHHLMKLGACGDRRLTKTCLSQR